MAALKLIMAATAVFFIAGAALIDRHPMNPAVAQPFSPVPLHIRRREVVQEHYLIHLKRLRGYYESLSVALKATAGDLLPTIELPRPLQHGYQILPKIVADTPLPGQRARAQSAWYSWPWTEALIDSGIKEIVRAEADLRNAVALSTTARRGVYEKLARSYKEIRDRQQRIEEHIDYNRLWQAAIAADRSRYDRETVLHNEVLERQAILDALDSLGATFKNAPGGLNRIGLSRVFAGMTSGLRERERLLAQDIHNATAHVSTPDFLRVEQRGPHLWILQVPFFTDIEDRDFVESAQGEIESFWRLRDGEDEFRVEVAFSHIPLKQLYTESRAPEKGQQIDAYEHLDLFPPGGAILTTGALTTHVYGRAIVLGPHDVAPRILAHEFGHILGFKDSYFRGYKDLGKNGFRVMEVVAEPNDIMGAPGSGRVLRSHFERILERSLNGKGKRS
ncbi:MAG: hypothetical protein HY695_12945 [Deltaproteobacteria bacterium]|nr:hypothetical protein [Deltaproteobacteria bacterium]